MALILLAAAGLSLLLALRAAGADTVTVEIRRDGELLQSVPLTRDGTYTVEGDYQNVVVVRDGAVWVEESTCPGADCVHSGPIRDAGRAIVCLPNRVEIRLVGGAPSDVDMVVG